MMDCTFQTIAPKLLVGNRVQMSYDDNKTVFLWRNFMPRRNEIQHRVGNKFISLQHYPDNFLEVFDAACRFEKWATVEVTSLDNIPEGMESMELPGGLYAVFAFKGGEQDAPKAFQYIFGEWLPQSGYELDHRPHFEELGDKYNRDSNESEEDIWIPIRKKE